MSAESRRAGRQALEISQAPRNVAHMERTLAKLRSERRGLRAQDRANWDLLIAEAEAELERLRALLPASGDRESLVPGTERDQ